MVVKSKNRRGHVFATNALAAAAACLVLNSCCCPEPPRPTRYDPRQNPRDPSFSRTQPGKDNAYKQPNHNGNETPAGTGGYGGGGDKRPGPTSGSTTTTSQPTGTASSSSVCGSNPLSVIGIAQEGFYSCWSTSAQMIMEYQRAYPSATRPYQCSQANNAFWAAGPALACCTATSALDTSDADCDQAGYPRFDQWMFNSTPHTPIPAPTSPPAPPVSALSWAAITTEIDACRPFCFSWKYNAPTGVSSMAHMLVVVGYDTPTQMIKVLDPGWQIAPTAYWIPYSEYVGSTSVGAYAHDIDIYEIQ